MDEPFVEARRSLEAFLVAWNKADIAAVRAELNFPHVTVGPSGHIFVVAEPEAFTTDFAKMRAEEQWGYSVFDDYRMFDASPLKVHCDVRVLRFHPDGTQYFAGRVLYIVTQQNGHWGMQVRSGTVSLFAGTPIA